MVILFSILAAFSIFLFELMTFFFNWQYQVLRVWVQERQKWVIEHLAPPSPMKPVQTVLPVWSSPLWKSPWMEFLKDDSFQTSVPTLSHLHHKTYFKMHRLQLSKKESFDYLWYAILEDLDHVNIKRVVQMQILLHMMKPAQIPAVVSKTLGLCRKPMGWCAKELKKIPVSTIWSHTHQFLNQQSRYFAEYLEKEALLTFTAR